MIRILQVSDVHLGAPMRGFGDHADQRGAEIRNALRELPATAERLNVDLVLLVGDLFDSPQPDGPDVDLAREVLRTLHKNGARPVFAIPGNHDRCSTPASPWHSMPEGVHVILEPRFGNPCTVRVRDTNVHVYGVAFDPAIEPDPLPGYSRSAEDGLHLLLLHAGISDNPDWTGGHGLRVSGAAIADIDAHFVALGDYHGCRMPADMPGERSAYAGSFAAVRPGETGLHGALVIDLHADVPPAARLEPSGAPQLIEIESADVSDAQTDLDAADRIGAVVDRSGVSGTVYPVVRMIGEPAYPLDIERITDAVAARFGFAVVTDETRFIDSDRLRALAREPTIVGHVARLGIRRLEQQESEDERRIAERALRIALRALEEA